MAERDGLRRLDRRVRRELLVRGGRGGVAARTDDMRRHAQQLESGGDALRAITDELAAVARPDTLLLTAAISPSTAARAELSLLEAVAELGWLAIEVEASADVLRTRAAAVDVADTVGDEAGHALDALRAPFLAMRAVEVTAVALTVGAADGAVRTLAREVTQRLGGETEIDDGNLIAAGAGERLTRAWTALLQETPEVVDGLVNSSTIAADALLPHAVDREELLALITMLGAHGGRFVDGEIDVGATSVTAGTAPSTLHELVVDLDALMDGTRHDPSASAIAVVRVDRGAEGAAWIVQIPGTQEWSLTPGSDPSDSTTNVHLSATGDAALLDAIDDAMVRAGVGRDDPVLVAGHSQGGIAAAAFATQAEQRGWTVSHVLTLGSPIAHLRLPPTTQGLSVEHLDDLVPRLDGRENEPTATHVQVQAWSDAPLDAGPFGPHSLQRYAATVARLEHAGDPSVDAWLSSVEGHLGGEAVTTTFSISR